LCEPVLRVAVTAAGVDAAVWTYPFVNPTTVTHVVAIERVGPSWGGGPPRNMRGEDISAWTAPLDRLFQPGPYMRIGIGDGGNELGMGALPHEVVASAVPHGDVIHCPVGSEALIVAGTSNWGAAGLVAALGVRSLLEPAWSWHVLDRIVDAGAVDGVLRIPARSVDGLDWDSYSAVLRQLLHFT